MMFDLQNQLSAAQAISGGPTVSTNSYQKASAAQDISIGRRMALVCMPTVAAGTGTSVLIEAIQADDAALTSNVLALASITVAAAKAFKGAILEVPIPQGVMSQLYLGARYTCTGGTTTITVDTYLVPQDEIALMFKDFPKAVNAQV